MLSCYSDPYNSIVRSASTKGFVNAKIRYKRYDVGKSILLLIKLVDNMNF